MTCREKLAIEHPDCVDEDCMGGCEGCPSNYGYLERSESCLPVTEEKCRLCWDREIPGDEALAAETETEKENNIATTKKTETEKENNMATTKKTKAELMEELESIKASKVELEKELKNLEKYKQYEDMASELHAIYTAFVVTGFSEEQAFKLLKTMLQNANQFTSNTAAKLSFRYA